MNDPTLIRTLGLLLPLTSLGLLWLWIRPDRLQATGALLASAWTIPSLLLLHQLETHINWWQFEAEGGQFQGVPVDLFLARVLLWGAIPTLAFPCLNLILIIVLMLGIDLILMPTASPVVQLNQYWWVGEAVGSSSSPLPAQLLARWTTRQECLASRVTLIALGYVGINCWVLPTLILELTGGSCRPFLDHPTWVKVLGGTGLGLIRDPWSKRSPGVCDTRWRYPIPFDPPKRVVSSGVYAYLASPM